MKASSDPYPQVVLCHPIWPLSITRKHLYISTDIFQLVQDLLQVGNKEGLLNIVCLGDTAGWVFDENSHLSLIMINKHIQIYRI